MRRGGRSVTSDKGSTKVENGEQTIRVSIVQEYVPAYRIAFFEELRRDLAGRGIELALYYGRPNTKQASRADSAHLQWAHPIRQREWSLGRRRLVLRQIPRAAWRSELVILEQARRNVDLYLALLTPSGRRRICLWGHGADYIKTPSPRDRRILRALSKRARHLFVYTESGQRRLLEMGIEAGKVTVVQNATDTRSLSSQIERIGSERLEYLRDRYGLQSGCVALYIGALDESKNLGVLLDAVPHVQQRIPNFRLLIGGSGPLKEMVERRSSSDAITYLGPLDGSRKAEVLALSDLITIPGRVGLVAADSIAAGKPIITTADAVHAPEVDYLLEESAIVTTASDAACYGGAIAEQLGDESKRMEFGPRLARLRGSITLEEMVARFAQGIEKVVRQ